jgi:hypothetical protein
MILVVGLIVASAGLSRFTPSAPMSAQVSNISHYRISAGTTEVSLQADKGETGPNGAYLQNVTLTIGDVVVTADDALVIGTEIQLGVNARMRSPAK